MLDKNDILQIKNLMLDTLEPFFIKIYDRFDNHDMKFDRIEADFAELKDDVKVLKTDVTVLKDDVNGLKTDVAVLKDDVNGLKTDVAGLKKGFTRLENDFTQLNQLKPKIEESHQWIGALVDNKETRNAEIDNLNHKVARVEGVLQGFADSLEPFRKAE
ncbi:MAG: hypothetical protein ACOY4Q_07565 [Bacillota bacterium]